MEEAFKLQNKIESLDLIKYESEGHMNQNQKIKYVLWLKEENNDLKKHLL